MKKFFLGAVCALALFAQTSFAQITLDNSGTYSTNFNDIGAGLPPGWSVRTGATSSSLGTAVSLNTATSVTWGATTGQFANYASTSNGGTNFVGTENTAMQSGATNRAPGIRQTSTFGNPGGAFVLQITNTLGFTNLQISLDFLMLSVQGYSTVWTVDYAVGNTPTSFISPPVPFSYSDPGVYGTTHTNVSFGTALDNQTENVWIRIVALSAATGSGSRDTFGIDNFALTYNITTAVTNPPTITVQPQSRTNSAASTANFTTAVTGTQPFTYQWLKNTTNLANGGNISGVTTTNLTISAVTKADEGTYSCLITNAGGASNTVGATLTVNDPAINSQPTTTTNLVGENQSFSVSASGTATIEYKWRKNGANITDATNSTVVITNISAADVASYSVLVTNPIGTLTSSIATLSLLTTPSVRIAQWDFNDTNSSTIAPAPSIGTGTASLVGGATAVFTGGVVQDPKPTGTNADWDVGTFPAAAVGNKTAGAQFNFSTLGYQDILLSWHEEHTLTASRYTRMQYSADGTNFTDFAVITRTNINTDRQVVDLSSVPAVNNNSNFAFRVVAEFENTAIGSTNTNYVACGSSSSYSPSGGKLHIDWLNVFANPVIRLNAQQIGNNIVLSWTNNSVSLQTAPLVTGTYTNIPGATSPYTNAISGSQKYFRLRGN